LVVVTERFLMKRSDLDQAMSAIVGRLAEAFRSRREPKEQPWEELLKDRERDRLQSF